MAVHSVDEPALCAERKTTHVHRCTVQELAEAALKPETLADYCVVLCWLDSAAFRSAKARDGRRPVAEREATIDAIDALVILSRYKPVIVIDQSYDDQFGAVLMGDGILDYLNAEALDAQSLDHSLGRSILRHGARRDSTSPVELGNCDVDWIQVYQTYCDLPPRERQVLDLLLDGKDPKQIASKLGTNRSTVRGQIKCLKAKFGVSSLQQLGVLVVRAIYEKKRRE